MKNISEPCKGYATLLLLCLLLLSCSLFAGEGPSQDEQREAQCRVALDRVNSLSTLSAEEARHWLDAVLELCDGVDDPELQVQDAVFRSWNMTPADKRLFLENAVSSYRAAESESRSLLPIYDALVGVALQDECDVATALNWANRAEQLRQASTSLGESDLDRDLTARATHKYAIGTCFSELGRDREAERQFQDAEQSLRQALENQDARGTFDVDQRMLLIDGLRSTLEYQGVPLDQDLVEEYDRLMQETM